MKYAAMISATLFATACAQQKKPCEQPLAFRPLESVPVGRLPVEVVAGDVDGDGVLDLVSADARAPSVSVLFGRGDATFTATRSLPITAHLLALADVDRDNDLDIVGTDHDTAGVTVWIGAGNRTFAAAEGSPFTALEGPPHNHGLGVADVSGDGFLDIVTANQKDQSVSVLLGDGAGKFAPANSSPIRLGAEPYISRIGDIDGDQKLDIVVPLISGSALVVLRGDGKGGFAHAPGSPYETIDRPYSVAVGDLNADGRADVVVAHDDTDKISVFLGQTSGALAQAEGSPMSLGARLFGMAIADLNGDGAVEVIGGAGDRLIILVQQPGRNISEACISEVTPLQQGWSVTVADLDRDGQPELIAPDALPDLVKIWSVK
jgi:hypothetical protein